jgi:hypothetical protein
MTDGEPIWVCANCRSVNKLRAKQCYNCRTPKDRAAVDPLTEHVGARTVALPEFHSSRPYAILATVLILVIGVVQAFNSLASATLVLRMVDGDMPAEAEIVNTSLLGLTTLGIGFIALIAWAAWLSKAVRVMPALGLGYPAANGLMAFVESLIPVLNLWRVPAIVRDIVRRLEPNESKGGALIFAAWIGLITGYLLPRYAGTVNFVATEDFDAYARNQALIHLVSAGLVLTGSVFLVALIWWIEGRISRHRNARPEVASASSAGPAATAVTEPSWVEPPASAQPAVRSVAGPLGTMVVAAQVEPFAARPITALTGGAASAPTLATAAAVAGVPSAESAPPAVDAAPPVVEAAPTPEPAPAQSTGPRLDLTIAQDGSMVATLDGESEAITIDELRDAAIALAGVDGSAVIDVGDGTIDASTTASRALRILGDAGVSATIGQG